MTTIAEKYWDAERAHRCAEEPIDEVMVAIFGDAWDEWTSDCYDCSIEIYGVRTELTDQEWALIWAAGFVTCWLHEHTGGRVLPDGLLCKLSLIHI